ncbi:IS91 family transposase [Marinobacterium sp. D7]|uniref:IS91 family transposase n=1 Tax=Marinobacterium ramblicola TaxID=2849041 RepID=UPI001C2D5177|nr:IS91 family transposase [Marinobacterium ramblicola]MBV1790849.1 IS91 family transposase [Marinobacterium ramblicola]
MSREATVQSALNRYLDPRHLTPQQRKVCLHLQACRTEAMGGRLLRCNRCDGEQRWYHGCRDRHCPQCQGRATRQWAERQRESGLPVAYYHLVFTLPHALNGWAQCHPEVIYACLFKSVWMTLKAFAADPRRLGGQLGMTAVLHTWDRRLGQHLHLHCLVPGGVLGADGDWKAVKGSYLFPVRALSRYFRGVMVGALRHCARTGELQRIETGEVDRILSVLMQQDWVVYTRHCLSHTDAVIEYLARYSHRIAITNARLLAVDAAGVRLRYKDSRTDQHRILQLSGEEFVRRFLRHILPKGFMRIRHYGFLAGCCRATKLDQIRDALAHPSLSKAMETTADSPGDACPCCPLCGAGVMQWVAELIPTASWAHRRRR